MFARLTSRLDKRTNLARQNDNTKIGAGNKHRPGDWTNEEPSVGRPFRLAARPGLTRYPLVPLQFTASGGRGAAAAAAPLDGQEPAQVSGFRCHGHLSRHLYLNLQVKSNSCCQLLSISVTKNVSGVVDSGHTHTHKKNDAAPPHNISFLARRDSTSRGDSFVTGGRDAKNTISVRIGRKGRSKRLTNASTKQKGQNVADKSVW